ncbi:MAG: hypothetical protein IPH62_20015 [Ignavibacteriae bacterium]|nr:hypothetical protein [Ignavibacteriota bacterium]
MKNTLQKSKVTAGEEYKAGSVKEFFGKHYRDSWTTEIVVPYLNLDTKKKEV